MDLQTPAAASSSKRRLAAQSDEEIQAHIVETRSRVGWPELKTLPCDYDLGIRDPSIYFDDFPAMWTKLEAVLVSHQVRRVVAMFVQRKTGRGSSPSRPTILVHGIGRETGSWFHAVLGMARIIQDAQVDLQEVIAVEIIDQDYLRPRLLPIESSNPLRHVWDSALAPAIMSYLRDHNAAWSTLSLAQFTCIRMNGPEKDPWPVVVLEVPDAESPHWERWTKELTTVAMGYQCGLEVWQSQHHLPTAFDSVRMPQRMWGDEMQMGDSIAATDDESLFGTLGGFITLEQPDGVRSTFALTNSHVVKSSPNLLRDGTQAPSTAAHGISVPADADTISRRERLEWMITCRREIMYGSPGQSQVNRRPPLVERAEHDEMSARQLEKAKQDMAAWEKDLASTGVDNRVYHAGTIHALSPPTATSPTGQQHALDWALVALDPKRDYTTWFPLHEFYGSPLPRWLFGELTHWTTLAAAGDRVTMVGRTSRWTSCTLNRATAFVNREGGVVARCAQVLRILRERESTPAFAQPEDCGAVVLDRGTGAACGVLFGVNPLFWYGLVTDAGVVFESIEGVTGGRVVEPRRLE